MRKNLESCVPDWILNEIISKSRNTRIHISIERTNNLNFHNYFTVRAIDTCDYFKFPPFTFEIIDSSEENLAGLRIPDSSFLLRSLSIMSLFSNQSGILKSNYICYIDSLESLSSIEIPKEKLDMFFSVLQNIFNECIVLIVPDYETSIKFSDREYSKMKEFIHKKNLVAAGFSKSTHKNIYYKTISPESESLYILSKK